MNAIFRAVQRAYETAKAAALEYREIFGDDFYLEIMRHGIKRSNGYR